MESPMSLGGKLSLHASAARGSNNGGVARSRREHETVAWPHRNTSAVGEHEFDRASGAVENLRVAVLVLAVRIARPVRPPVHVARFVAQTGLDPGGIRRRGSAVPPVLNVAGCHGLPVRSVL
jgi:hypothetical protein